MVGAEATVYVWFCARSAKMQVNFGTQASHSGTEYFFLSKNSEDFFLSYRLYRKQNFKEYLHSGGCYFQLAVGTGPLTL